MDKADKRNSAIVFIILAVAVLMSGGVLFLRTNCTLSQIDLQACIDSTVLIEIDGRHTGSGFVVASVGKEALIITARHVVDRKGNYAVVFADGSVRNVQAVRISSVSDVAILLVHKANLRPLILETEVQVGQPIIVIGSPLDREYFNYVTRGIVSKIGVMDSWLSDNPLIMIDAAANLGNSGGPVLNLHGEVIGILIAGYPYNCGLNFITPSVDIFVLLESWHDEGPNFEERMSETEEEFSEEFEGCGAAS